MGAQMDEVIDPWCKHVSAFRIINAQVTAVPDGGEMIVRDSLNLLVEEGRQEALRDDEKGNAAPSALEYFCRVTLDGAGEPQVWTGEDARIVISGIHENGSRITIAGPGAVGSDEKGSLELEFEKMPQMKVVQER